VGEFNEVAVVDPLNEEALMNFDPASECASEAVSEAAENG